MTNEMLISEINKAAKHDPAVAQWLNAAVGGVVNKVGGKSSNSGAVSYTIDQGVNAYQDVYYGPKNAEERQADNIAYTDEVIQDGFEGIKD